VPAGVGEEEEMATTPVSKAVLITGCSSGIGRATAERLAGSGWTVYASARRLASIERLAERGCKLLELDVCDEVSMRSAVESVVGAEGAVGVLVNNAGYSQSGAIEDVPMDQVRRQFETNVFGLVRLTQLVLPGMRGQGWGKIVNLSSMGGRLTFPGGGFYHATKHAVEAISDALRFEVRGFGIDVIVVEPGLIKTSFGDTAVGAIEQATPEAGPYADFNAAVARATAGAYDGLFGKLGGGPEAVAKKVEKAISARRPRTRYPVTPSARLILAQRRLLPDRGWDAFMRTQFPSPRRPE
jgi:NAD(P)-dependent dehydrogenase (short-subunit alcohol dehydrogenase family)